MVRLSILEVTWKEIRVGKLALDGPGDDVHRGPLGGHHQVDAGRAGHLGQALDRRLDVLAGDQHEVGHLVDHHHDVGQRLQVDRLVLVQRVAGVRVEADLDLAGQDLAAAPRLLDPLVVAVDIAHAELRHGAVAVLHLPHRPLQGDDGLLRLGDDRRQQMRNVVVDRQLQHLGVDHDEAAFLRRQAVEQRQDHRVQRDRLARARGAGDQQVRHARQVDDLRHAADVLAQDQRQLAAGPLEALGAHELPQVDRLALVVGQLDADHVGARDHGDADRDRAHRPGDVVGQPDHAAGLGARGRRQLVAGHHRAGPDLDDLAAHPEVLQHRLQEPGVLLQGVAVHRPVARVFGRVGQQAQRRGLVVARAGEGETLLVRLLRTLARLGARRRRRDQVRTVGQGSGAGPSAGAAARSRAGPRPPLPELRPWRAASAPGARRWPSAASSLPVPWPWRPASWPPPGRRRRPARRAARSGPRGGASDRPSVPARRPVASAAVRRAAAARAGAPATRRRRGPGHRASGGRTGRHCRSPPSRARPRGSRSGAPAASGPGHRRGCSPGARRPAWAGPRGRIRRRS